MDKNFDGSAKLSGKVRRKGFEGVLDLGEDVGDVVRDMGMGRIKAKDGELEPVKFQGDDVGAVIGVADGGPKLLDEAE